MLISKRATEFVRAPGYGPDDAMKDAKRLHHLNFPPAYGGGELKGAEDEEEALLTARLAAYRHSPEGRGRRRIWELELKGIGGRRLSMSKRNWIRLSCSTRNLQGKTN